jgi:hypothetical protein
MLLTTNTQHACCIITFCSEKHKRSFDMRGLNRGMLILAMSCMCWQGHAES